MKLLTRLVLGSWLASVIAIGAALTALHDTPLPLPGLVAGVATGEWTLLHAVSSECGCSQRLLAYLAERGATDDAVERILLVAGDEAMAAPLRERGFEVELVDEEALATRYEIRGVPSLVVRRPDGTVAYAGAHRPRPQMDPIDLSLLDDARGGAGLASVPVTGCAVSDALQERLDPLGLKYSGTP